MTAPGILLTGATGNIGTALAQQLSALRIPFRALVRNPDHAGALKELPGAVLVTGDLADPASLQLALQGVQTAFLLTNSSEQAETLQHNFVKAAASAGVQHIVKLSQWGADAHSPVRFLRYHAAIEQQIREAGISYTFLRPNLFMQGLLGFKDSIRHQGQFFAAIGNARVSAVDVRDIAAVAVKALTEPGHDNKIYHLTGPQALTHGELATLLSEALHKPVTFIDVPAAAMLQGVLQAGFPQWQAEGLIEDYAHYARGEAAIVTDDIEKVTGTPARSFEAFAKDYAGVFLG